MVLGAIGTARVVVWLPCNVVVRQSEGRVLVHALDPAVMVSIPERTDLQGIADEAGARVADALDTAKRLNPG